MGIFMKKLYLLAFAIVGIFACLYLTSCDKDDSPNDFNLVGLWLDELGDVYDFKKDGFYDFYEDIEKYEANDPNYFGTWKLSGDFLYYTEDGSYLSGGGIDYNAPPYSYVDKIVARTENKIFLKYMDSDEEDDETYDWVLTRYK